MLPDYHLKNRSARFRSPRIALNGRKMWVIFFLMPLHFKVAAQNRRMVAIGSSTTAGYGTSSIDSCWFGRFRQYYQCRLQAVTSCTNYGVPGSNVYDGMPTSFAAPAGRPGSDTSKNITKALVTLNTLQDPDDGVIIVNYPSNDYNVYSIGEIMNCLQLIYDSAFNSGHRCFITTTQPRTDSLFKNSLLKRKLADIKDSIINRFGDAHTLNFWDDMYNPADTTILAIYNSGDDIHFNNLGHRILFEKIKAKNVFNLPVWYAMPTGDLNRLSSWGSNLDGSGSHPANFSADYQTFIVVNNPTPTISGNLTINGKNSQLIIGDGEHPVLLTISVPYQIRLISPQPVGSCD